jgi:hypothetical protein
VTDDELKDLRDQIRGLEISAEELKALGLDQPPSSVLSTGARIPRLKPTYSPQAELIPIDSIIIRERQRGGKINGRGEGETIKDLEDSFEAVGFFGTILVCKLAPCHRDRFAYLDNTLVFGFRRREAAKGRGEAQILAQFVTPHPDDPNPEATLQSIELFEDIKRLNRDPINIMSPGRRSRRCTSNRGCFKRTSLRIFSASRLSIFQIPFAMQSLPAFIPGRSPTARHRSTLRTPARNTRRACAKRKRSIIYILIYIYK